MADECVVDTVVLVNANKLLSDTEHDAMFARRLKLLESIQSGKYIVLISKKLMQEYNKELPQPRNDFIKAFFEIVSDSSRSVTNWVKLTGALREIAHKCRFPWEDMHVLRTAIRERSTSTIFSEENRMLVTDKCIHREVRVHIRSIPE